MKTVKNNKGFSLIELLVAVTILSIIMAGVAWMLSVMSRSFGNSQREVQLQDSVQATYNIVSDLIKESQTEDMGTAIEYNSSMKRAYILDEEKGNSEDPENSPSKFYIIELADGGNLYLYAGSRYQRNNETGSYEKIDYKAVPPSDIQNRANLLAKNVTQFVVDTSKLGEGYVVLGIEAQYGSRKASITQNVYLRNSNKSAEWQQGGDPGSGDTDEEELEGYTLESIIKIEQLKKFYVGSTPTINDFKLTGKYSKEGEDDKEAEIPKSDIKCEQLNKKFDESGDHDFTFEVNGTDIKKDITVDVLLPTASLTHSTTPALDAGLDSINFNSDICVSYTSNRTGTMPKPSSLVVMVCPMCGSSVSKTSDNLYKCEGKGSNPYCGNIWNLLHESDLQTVYEVSYGDGQIIITNKSKDKDYESLHIRLSFESSGVAFLKGGDGYLELNGDGTNGNKEVTYSIVGSDSDETTRYIELEFTDLPKAENIVQERGDYTQYVFDFHWVGNCSGTPCVSVFYVK